MGKKKMKTAYNNVECFKTFGHERKSRENLVTGAECGNKVF